MIAPETGAIYVAGQCVPFTVSRSKRRRRTIAFRYDGEKGLQVMAPMRASLTHLTRVMQANEGWVARKLAQRQAAQPECDYKNGSIFTWMGRPYALHITQGDAASSFVKLRPHHLYVHIADGKLSPKALDEEVRLEIMLWAKKRARLKFKQRLDLWASRMDVKYKKLVISGPERRWGSCSVDNIIRLNWRLILVPLELLDYVAAHELAHVRHKNHSLRFWNFLEKSMPDWKARRKHLRTLEGGLVV